MKSKVISVMLAATLIGGYLPIEVKATEKNEFENTVMNESFKGESYVEGTYEVKNSVLKIDSDNASVARKYVGENSKIIISNQGIKATIDFTDKTLMSNIKIKVGGKEVKYTSSDIDDKVLRTEFEVDSLDQEIEVSSVINTGFFKMDVSFRVKLDTTNIPLKPNEPDQKPEDDNVVDEIPENKPEDSPSDEQIPESPEDNNQGENEEDTSQDDENIIEEVPTVPEQFPVEEEVKPPVISESENGTVYKIKNAIITDSQIGYTAARGAVNSTSYLEEINGEKYLTLGISQLNLMSNIRVSVAGQKINYSVVRKNSSNNTMDIRFKIPSESSKITISAFIDMTGMDISFGLDLLEETKEVISKFEASAPLAKPSSDTIDLAATKESSSEEVKEEKIASEIKANKYFKKFTVENEIISDSAMGKAMTRKYVDKVSILEEIDGKLYLTLKFTGTNSMDNIKIKVNSNDVDYDVVASNDETGAKAFRFEISDINDDIRVYMFIKPVKMNVDFGIDLLEETKTLVEEGTVDEAQTQVQGEDKVLNALLESNSKSSTSTFKIVGITALATTGIIGVIQGIVLLILKKRRLKKKI